MTSESPLISVITPVYNPPLGALREAIESVLEQNFDDWELVLVDDRSPNAQVREVLHRAAAADRRIRVVERAENGGIVAASNDAIAEARGTFLVLLDHDDRLAVDTFETLVPLLESIPDLDYVYSDEDKIDAQGVHYDAFYKPAWSPERLRHQMYTSHLSVIRTALAREVGGFRTGFDGSQDHDLVLRVTERARRIEHVEKVLYHWRVVPGSTAGDPLAKPYTWEAGRKAVDEHLARVGIAGEAVLGPLPGTYRVRRVFDDTKSISVIIPTRGSSGIVWGENRCFVTEAVRSIVATCDASDLEIVVVYDLSTPPAVLDDLTAIAGPRLVLVPFAEKFNFSAKCNVGFVASRGDIVILMNDDVELREDGVIEQLCAPLSEPDVGMVGARLLLEDGRLQHGGHAYEGGDWYHLGLGAGSDDNGSFGALVVGREVVGLTAAFIAMRRETYADVGGLCEVLPVNFNDVDLSYKVRGAGYRLLWLPEVTAYHFESRTREPLVHQWEVDIVVRRWGTPTLDPYLRSAPDLPAAES